MNQQVLAFLFVLTTILLTADFARGRGVSETGGAKGEQEHEDMALMERLIDAFPELLNASAVTNQHANKRLGMTGSVRIPTAEEMRDAWMSKSEGAKSELREAISMYMEKRWNIPHNFPPVPPESELLTDILKLMACAILYVEYQIQIEYWWSVWEYMCIAWPWSTV